MFYHFSVFGLARIFTQHAFSLRCFRSLLIIPIGLVWLMAGVVQAQSGDEAPPLSAGEVAVVANYSVPGSVELARHYMEGRGIPKRQLLVTGMPQDEVVSRLDYERFIAGPIKEFLTGEKLDRVRCLVLMYGVPVKVLEPIASNEDRRIELIIREDRPQRLAALIAMIKQAHALAPEGKQPATPAALPRYNPQAHASQQIRGLAEQLMGEFTTATTRLASLPVGPERQRAAADWLALWIKAFGFTSPSIMGLDDAPEPGVPEARKQECARRIRELATAQIHPATYLELVRLVETSRGISGVIELCDVLLQRVKPDWTHRAAVDSELCTLFWPDFSTVGPVPNPFYVHIKVEGAPRTLMACRLDGPDEAVVRRMIDTSLAVEKTGLRGKIYLDARGLEGDSGYGAYDTDLRKLGTMIDEFTTLTAVVDNKAELFQKGQCPGAALYCGWYSLSRYVDAFSFVPGAVGYHLASSEAVGLHRKDATTWCPQLLAHGVVATLGPVDEPYLTSFPRPSEFFGLLLTGRYPLADCYFKTLPRLSWMLTLIGDPLYKPYAAHPALEAGVLRDILFEDSAPADPQ